MFIVLSIKALLDIDVGICKKPVDTEMYYCKNRYYNPVLRRFISLDSIEYLDPSNINGMNLYTYCYNDPVNYSDGSGHMPEWAQWLIGGALVVGAIALTICTAGAGGALAIAMGGGFWATVGSGALVGAVVGAASGALMSAGTQIIANGFENFSWSEVGKGAITGCIAGGIAGGFFAGIQYGLSAGKIANSVSGLSKAQTRLDNVFKPLNNIKNLSNMPFSGANIARNIGQVAGNYNSAYSAYILAKGAYAIVNTTAKVLYFVLENLTSNLIGSMF
ncbi:RHS repeat-associated core domain-containing protein [Thomasclavelia cocleata]|uniref:RHS repeat-associated core domain-containing protein n=1 Tax=Thomasclavelia cocleata TaxID=69824 RepID=UPI002587C25A|nr:RHS repeat-associated core domain-containing protein [Thomasclavelia cocleata]